MLYLIKNMLFFIQELFTFFVKRAILYNIILIFTHFPKASGIIPGVFTLSGIKKMPREAFFYLLKYWTV